ncbi:MAG: RNA 2',3'-cyclic phosphodiesterase [Anaerolineales bacterium]|jgi:2'-5' RNA ligase
MDKPDTLRTFVGLDFPEAINQQLFSIQQELRAQRPDDVMEYPPVESFHLTLFYLGGTPKAVYQEIENALMQVGEAFEPFSLTLEGLGVFSTKESFPLVFFVNVHDPTGQLQVLYAAVRDCVGRFGYTSDYPSYHPHVTLCKASPDTPPEMLEPFGALAQNFKVPSLGEIEIKEMTFYQSVPDREMAVYEPLKVIPLGKNKGEWLGDQGQ